MKLFLSGLFAKRKIPGFVYTVAGSFIVSAGWSWYHIYRHPKWIFVSKASLIWLAVLLGYYFAKYSYKKLVHFGKRHIFWRDGFYQRLDELFFFSSLIFLVFFSQKELLSIIYSLVLLPLIYYRLQKAVSGHPGARPWVELNRSVFGLAYFIFCFEALVQFAAYHYYILDNNIRFFNIVLFRSFAMTAFWMAGFAVANEWYQRLKGFGRRLVFFIWSALFAFSLVVWTVNLGILYYSGLYFSPIALEHIEGSGGVVNNRLTYFLIFTALLFFIMFVAAVRMSVRKHAEYGKKYSSIYNFSIIFLAVFALIAVSSFRNTPEHAIVQSFYRYYLGVSKERELSLDLQKKLAKFGLIYETNQFYVTSRPQIFSAPGPVLLPEKFKKKRPNILIIELESFSSRLTGPYGTKFPGLTPGLDEFAADPHTTLFRNYYNASTPTITGTLSQLCSFLPPTGHNEIQNERKLQSHHLLCLPEVLREKGGYKYAAYVTAVDKNFANKDGIFTSMGVDKVFGTSELKQYIDGEPLSWGYSDHQLFPATMNFMKTAPQPFLMMLATVDTHPPFDLAKDQVKYGDGTRPVLNSFHTTDDAFRKFWNEFKQSDLYQNTIVVAVADHAIFPGALTTDLFPEQAKSLTYYDENFFGIYIPESVLPREYRIYSSGIDIAPTLLQLLNINIANSFEGHSIFDDRKDFPNLLGMHELGLYINEVDKNGKRVVQYDIPSEIDCDKNDGLADRLTLCDYLSFYEWKRQMFEQGRFWKH